MVRRMSFRAVQYHSERPMSFRAKRGISPSFRRGLGGGGIPPSGSLHNLVIPTKVGIQKVLG